MTPSKTDLRGPKAAQEASRRPKKFPRPLISADRLQGSAAARWAGGGARSAKHFYSRDMGGRRDQRRARTRAAEDEGDSNNEGGHDDDEGLSASVAVVGPALHTPHIYTCHRHRPLHEAPR
eukprot:298098-Pyramimonas_sp.AAC.2